MASRAITAPGPHLPFADLLGVPAHRVHTLRERFPLVAQLARYAMVGGLGTAVNAGLYLLARLVLGPVPANLVALVLSTAVSTEVNRRFTFDGATAHRWRVYVQDLGTVVFYAGYSTAVLLLVDEWVPDATPLEETAAVTAASVLGGLLRFLVLKAWVFDTHHERTDLGPDAVGHHDPRSAGRAGAAGAAPARVPAEPRDVAAGDGGVGGAPHGGRAGPAGLRGVGPSALG
ncbi:GtrA family protein [Pseudonocardia pini]|uniref:GtrA family protein n=1 Tax=Pseudonocardia pini TaxID=2758030 RepID=UPI0028ADE7AA|nr:GtrA family protein [Pseudonocardia pini]